MGAYPRKMVVDDLDFAIIGDNYDEKDTGIYVLES